jgi:hypothetical protein
MKKEKNSPDYYLGILVGEIIYQKYLPTMDVDMLHSKHVINVTPEEKAEADRLHDILNATYSDGTPRDKWGHKESTSIAHKNWINYIYKLAKIHLPETLHCRFEKIAVNDMNEFKKGLNDYLWDTDLSWYKANDNLWVDTHEISYYSEVILTLDVNG